MGEPVSAVGICLVGVALLLVVNWSIERFARFGIVRWILGAPLLFFISLGCALWSATVDVATINQTAFWVVLSVLGCGSIILIVVGARLASLGVVREDLTVNSASVASLSSMLAISGLILITSAPGGGAAWLLTAVGVAAVMFGTTALVLFVSKLAVPARLVIWSFGIGMILLSIVLHNAGAAVAVLWLAVGSWIGVGFWHEWRYLGHASTSAISTV